MTRKIVLAILLGVIGLAFLGHYFQFLKRNFVETPPGFLSLSAWPGIISNTGDAYPELRAVKRMFLPLSGVDVSVPKNFPDRLRNCLVPFLFYPLRHEPGSAHVVDFRRSFQPPGPGWRFLDFSDRVRLYVKPGAVLPPKADAPYQSAWIFGVALLMSAAYMTVVGFGFCSMMRVDSILPSFATRVALSYLTGTLTLAWAFWIYLMAGGLMTRDSVLGVWGIMGILSMGGFWLTHRRRERVFPLPGKDNMKIEARWVLIFIGIFLPLFLTWLRTFNVMLFTWDEMASWTMRAKTLFYEGQFVKSFNSSAAYQPPVWPLTIASQYFLLGGDYDLVSKWNSALASLCLLVMIRACLGMTGLVSWAAWALAGLFMIGCDNWTAYQGLPEDMLLAVLTAAVAFALAWLKNPSAPRALICFAIMCVGVSSLKFEGMIYSLVLGGALWASMRGRLPFKWHLRIVVLFLLPVSVQWFWMLWLDANGYSISVHHLGNAFSWDKILALQGVFEEQFSVFEAAGVFVIASILFFFVDIFGKKWSEQELFLLLAWFGMIVFSVLGGMGWPLEDIGPYYRDVLTRLSVKAMPFLLFLLCLRLRGRGFIRIRGVNGLRKVFGE